MTTVDPKREITTITPTFRRPRLLRRAIRSVLSQTYPHFRVCVYDNASGDETRSVVDEFAKVDARVRYHCHPQNIGGLQNFIYGAERVETPFFSFLSDDDALLPKFYETAIAGFERYPEAHISITATVRLDKHGVVLSAPILDWHPGLYFPPDGMLSMIRHGHPEWTSVVFRREVVHEIGPPDMEVGGPSDLDFELNAAARFPVVVSSQPGAIFVNDGDSAGNSAGLEALCPGWGKIVCKIAHNEAIPKSVRCEGVRALNRKLRRILLATWMNDITAGRWSEADQVATYLFSCCRSTAEPYVLRLLSRGSQRLWLFRSALSGSIALRRRIRRAFRAPGTRRLQRQCAPCALYLETLAD